ncbi:hypothetical protein WA026_004390 [Henosepilachna vigintioctopunctata]|uniref:Uncharacterized protein n=1 Tax=Henosepilachna vigintioctopunctata TaxID=420089 RepID=A0AAW1V7J8_9CUCU
MKLMMTILGVAFWSCYLLFDMTTTDKSCKIGTESLYCPKNVRLAKGEILFYHTMAVTALIICFMLSLHAIFLLLTRVELSIFMMITTSLIFGLMAYGHYDVDNFGFHVLGFLVGVYGANSLIFAHLLFIHLRNKLLMVQRQRSLSDPIDYPTDMHPEAIEMRNEQPGCYFDINTRTHIYNFDHAC